MLTLLALAATLSATAPTAPLTIQADPAEMAEEAKAFQAFVGQLEFQTGAVSIADGSVSFDLPDGWALLNARDARRVVEEYWGNPEDPTTLAFLDPPSEYGRLGSDYGVIVTLDESGYVDDDDAASLDYAQMLKDMQDEAWDSNEARVKAGFGTIEIVGWAEPPHYDSAEKKLYWAKELSFDDSPATTLNYDVRILGRHGYLQLQAVAPMEARDEVDAGMKSILPVAHFTEGNRYSDFDSSTDNIAAYGIGALIGGKVAAKAGLFVVLAKFGKFIVLGIVGLFVAAKKFLFGRKENEHAYVEEDADEDQAE